MRKAARPAFTRYFYLYERLLKQVPFTTVSAARDLEVTPKTIQRDLASMRADGFPIVFDRVQGAYTIDGEMPDFPSSLLTAEEVVAVLVARQALIPYKGNTYAPALDRALQKISAQVAAQLKVMGHQPDQLPITFRPAGVGAIDPEVFKAAAQGLLWRKELTFKYQNFGADEVRLRRLQPYHLACIEHQWYLIGHDLDRTELRIFSLPRFRSVPELGPRFQLPQDFSIDAYLANSLGPFGGGDNPHKVVIHFDPAGARMLKERRWPSAFTTSPLPDGGVELTTTVAMFEDIESWILLWLGHATVIHPPALRERIAQAAKKIHQAHAQPAETAGRIQEHQRTRVTQGS